MENKKTYTYDEAYKAALEYFAGDELAARVWVSKYAMKDSFGNIYEQSPEDMHWRRVSVRCSTCSTTSATSFLPAVR